MCGICGEMSFVRERAVSELALTSMSASLRHRGPDHGAIYRSGQAEAGLGFRRLSIIDLRSVANQPIGNEDGSIQLVFNGEIYNYKQLRQALVARGHVFRSSADSEVIVHLYEERGERAIDALDGMFALAIWDGRRQELLLARDRAGKKPLFMWQDPERVVFASEIKAILAHPELDVSVDETAFPDFFRHGYVPHPQTFYRGVTHVEPGSVACFERSGRRVSRVYWQLEFPREGEAGREQPSFDAAARGVRDRVTAAVEHRLMSDVPLGAFLSGGIDSTIVVGVMSRLLSEPVRTFTIGFDGDPDFDETDIARETARSFGTRHTEFRVQPSALDLIDTLVYHHDGPFGDSSAIPTYLVSKLTREHVTVALTGDGGDEVFAGYLRFGAALAAERVPGWVTGLTGALMDRLPTPGNERHWTARARRFARHAGLPLEERLAAWSGIFYDDVDALLLPGTRSATRSLGATRPRPGLAGRSPLSRILAANFHGYLHDDLLVKADRMTMAVSLEARSPFLDRALMDYVAGLPDAYKLRGRTTKAVLRAAFDDLIPAQVKHRGKKGFGVPLDAWFRTSLRDYLTDTLLSPGARLRSHVVSAYVERLVRDHLAGRANHGHKLWTLLTFERWLQALPAWKSRPSVRPRQAI